MKYLALVFLAAISFAGAAYGHNDFTDRSEYYAAEPPEWPFFVAPLYSGQSVYVVAPPRQYRYIAPSRGPRERYR